MFVNTRAAFTRRVAVAGIAALGVLSPLRAGAENLADALVSAYNTSGLLEQNRAVLRATDEDVAVAVSALRPVIDWSLGYSVGRTESSRSGFFSARDSNELTLGLSVDLLLYDFGNTRLGIQAAKETVLATRSALLSIEQQILLRAVSAYMNTIRAADVVALRQSNQRLITQELRAARDRFEVGEVTRTDVALAEARLAEARSNLASAQGNLRTARQEYVNAVGRKPGQLSPPPRLPKRPASLDAAHAIAVRHNPDVIQLQHQVAAAEIAILRQKAAMKPRISLNGTLSGSEDIAGSDYANSSSLGVTMSQRLYQGGARSAALRSSMSTRDQLRYRLLEAQEGVQQNVTSAFVGLEVAQASLRATEQRIRAAQVAFRGVREEATLGARTTLDVLDAEQELLDARAARISAQTDQYIAAYQLVAAQGMLTAERLRLAVTLYDPAAYYNIVKDAPHRASKQGRELDRVLRALGKD